MAGGYEKNKQRNEALQLLGKDLARRAARKCELCEAGGVRLDPWEIPPIGDAPELERTLLLCETCAAGAGGGRLEDPERWRCLESAMWSDVTAIQVAAIRLLRRLCEGGVEWARASQEMVVPSAEAMEWLGE